MYHLIDRQLKHINLLKLGLPTFVKFILLRTGRLKPPPG